MGEGQRDGESAARAEGERVLIVRLSALGDVLQCLAALDALRTLRPNARIAWLVERRFAGVLEGHPQLERLFVFDRRRGKPMANFREMLRLRREMRAWGPDIALDVQGNLKGAMLTRLSGAPRRVGLPAGEAREGAHWLTRETIAPSDDPREHRSERALRLVRHVAGDSLLAPTPHLPDVGDDVRSAVRAGLSDGVAPGGFALLLPGTSDFGAFKRWPPAQFGALAGRIRRERGLPVLVGFGPGQLDLAEAVVASADGAAVLAPETTSLRELLALTADAALVVGSDSGPVVLGALAGTPTVTLFGPKDPLVYEARAPRAVSVTKRVYCSPCPLRECADPICMSQMTTDEVWSGVTRVLDGGEAA